MNIGPQKNQEQQKKQQPSFGLQNVDTNNPLNWVIIGVIIVLFFIMVIRYLW